MTAMDSLLLFVGSDERDHMAKSPCEFRSSHLSLKRVFSSEEGLVVASSGHVVTPVTLQE